MGGVMKICKFCHVEKDSEHFYINQNGCKECVIERVKENRLKNIDYYLAYDKARANNPDRVEARNKYSQTEQGKEVARKAKRKWREVNLIKRGAIQVVNNAVRDGKLIKEHKCQSCGVECVRIHGHHDDYAYPLSVRWLCSICHRKWHKENGNGLNGE